MFTETGTGALTETPAATAVFTAVLTEEPLSRVSLARRLGLSAAAVTKAARPLIEMDYLQELAATERTGPGAGRPASPLAVQADREFFVRVKITGDELIGAIFARGGNAIGTGIAAVANLVGPARIVVSGEGLAAYDLFETHIRAGFERQAFGAAVDCPLSIRPLPFEEWARGAAVVSIQSLVAT
jgi:hypothetical protein